MLFFKDKKPKPFDFDNLYFELNKFLYELQNGSTKIVVSDRSLENNFDDYLAILDSIWEQMSLLDKVRWELKWDTYLKNRNK